MIQCERMAGIRIERENACERNLWIERIQRKGTRAMRENENAYERDLWLERTREKTWRRQLLFF